MNKKPNPALAQVDSKERTLAERTLSRLQDETEIIDAKYINEGDNTDRAIEILNLAFLEAQCSARLDEVEPWELTIFPPRFHATVNGERQTFQGKVPPVNSVYEFRGTKYFVGSHK